MYIFMYFFHFHSFLKENVQQRVSLKEEKNIGFSKHLQTFKLFSH